VRAAGEEPRLETAAKLRSFNPSTYRWWALGIVIACAAVLIPAYWIALRAPAVGMFHDDGVYLVTAKALATGHGYRIISLPDEIPQTKYPILFPLALSFVWRLMPDFPANVFALKLVPFAFALVWFWLVFRLIALEASREVAAICAALTATLLWSVYLSTALLSETMFAALCTGGLLVLRRDETGGSEKGREWLLAGVLAGLACLTRTAGVCAVATGAIYFLRQRRFSRAAGFLAIALAVCAPWLWWLLTQHPPDTDAYYSAANYGSWNVLSNHFPLTHKITIVLVNALLLLRSPFSIAGMRWPGWPEILAGLTFLAAGLRWIRRWNVADIFLSIYVAMMLAWAWPPDRFVVVVYPLILYLAWRVWRAVCERFPEKAAVARAAGITILTVVLAQSLWNLAGAARATLRIGAVPVMGSQDSWSDTSRQLNWIRDQTPPGAIVLANLDPLFYLYTGRKAVRGFQDDPYGIFYVPEPGGRPLGSLANFRMSIGKDRVTYIVRAPNSAFGQAPYLDRLILELVRSEPEAIRLVAQGEDARFQIYRVERPL